MKVSFEMDLSEQVGCQQPNKRTGECARWWEPPERWHAGAKAWQCPDKQPKSLWQWLRYMTDSHGRETG